ncbi:MAG: hypothetical protein FWE28_08995 [Oscillospiraceae bacterium]|nr:hypothetical protein [Oscillospiraceae bacterium]
MKRIFLITIFMLILLAFTACANNTQEKQECEENQPVVSENQDAQHALRHRNMIQEILPALLNPDAVPRAHAFWRLYENVDALVTGAGDVVRAEILDQRLDWICMHMGTPPPDVDDPYLLVTVYRIYVLEVFQGETQPGEILEIMQTGAKVGERQLTIEMAPIAPGDDVVVFLLPYVDSPEGFIGMMNPFQSVYRFPAVSDGSRFILLDMDEILENIAPDESRKEILLTLTIDDLIDLQIESFGRLSESFEALLVEEARR